uniref:RNA-directed DNA polymerase n=1 Tax=Lygus hesperus TaxID=30085 RepID=A0A0A9WHB1_LYGHE
MASIPRDSGISDSFFEPEDLLRDSFIASIFDSTLSNRTPSHIVTHERITMSQTIALPPNFGSLEIDGVSTTNLSKKWSDWIKQFQLYLVASGLDTEADKRKVAILLSLIGPQSMTIFNSFKVDENTVSYEDLVKKFADHFTPKKNTTVERHNFFTRHQKSGESIDEYVTALKNLSQTCDFSTLNDPLIKDMLIVGLRRENLKIKERLLQEDNLDLDKALKICRSIELSKIQAESLDNSANEGNLNSISASSSKTSSNFQKPERDQQGRRHQAGYGKRHDQGERGRSKQRSSSRSRQRSSSNQYNNRSGQKNHARDNLCGRCGQIHRFRCPAYGIKCESCSKLNHYTHMCKARKVQAINLKEERYVLNNNNTNDDYFVCQVSSPADSQVWSVDLIINKSKISCLLDTGAQLNCMPLSVYESLGFDQSLLRPNNLKITTYCGNIIRSLGYCNLSCMINGKTSLIPFNIVNIKCQTVLGLRSCQSLDLIRRVNVVSSQLSDSAEVNKLLQAHKTCFEGLGKLPTACKLTLKEGAVPVVDAPRKLPFKIHEKVKNELDRMERDEVIAKVNEPSDWVSSMVVTVKKSGNLRVCIDPKNLNKNLKREHYQLPTTEDIRAKIIGASVFSTLDANSGFWIIPLDPSSSNLLTFNTPWGRYKFLRLPFGVSPASEIFHAKMQEIFGDLPGVIIFLDDILIFANSIEEHNKRLEALLERAKTYNVKFNKTKCKFCLPKIKYLGHVFSKDGVQADQDKVRAIMEMKDPEDKTGVQRFLGMVTYLGSFIQNLSEKTTPLRQLIKKDSQWEWQSTHKNAFENLKKELSSTPVLAHFDVKAPITLTVDASKSAVGCCLLQNGKPVAYASQTMTQCQQNYPQIGKELYAVVFACKRFYQYIFGQSVTVETDHAPLVTLSKKPLAKVPPSLQRMFLKLQPFELKFVHKPGRLMYVADALSRAALPEIDNSFDEDVTVHVNLIRNSLAVHPKTLEEIQVATSKDETLVGVITNCNGGWPNNKNQVSDLVKPFWNFRDELSATHGVLWKNSSIVIPRSMVPEILKKVHTSHMSAEKAKSLIRGVLFWPQMSTDIENFVQNCTACIKYKPNQANEPLIPHEIPNLPWQKLSADFFEFDSKSYLVLMDYFSKYIELVQMNSINAASTITTLKSIFGRHGIPLQLFTDNGPPWDSKLFQEFCKNWDIEHKTSSPNYARSNGQAESGVKIAKNILKKCREGKDDLFLALLHYRNTPKGKIGSPAQILMSRRLRCVIPVSELLLQPKVLSPSIQKNLIIEQQKRYKCHHDKKSRPLKSLQVGEKVYFKRNPKLHWEEAIVQKTAGTRSYIVQDSNGRTYRRNRVHIFTPPMSILKNSENNESPISPKPMCFSPSNRNCTDDVTTPVHNPSSPIKPNSLDRTLSSVPLEKTKSKSTVTIVETPKSSRQQYTRYGRAIKPPKRFTFTKNEEY